MRIFAVAKIVFVLGFSDPFVEAAGGGAEAEAGFDDAAAVGFVGECVAF